ncbi:hypothetical protein [Paenibacillus larvae]|uniref:hypothetical protein n=1 Tax=Paenibacillus larvae TaxID=1464 RepID=UPI00288F0BA4|nr:hypothetical protein [Paenibacillus larvae]MDT2192108.1 hypothetical protein [Paenibacillus larvae]
MIRFEDFRKKLPEAFQLDALLQLTNVCLSLGKWNLTEQFADELRILATIRYQEELLMKKNNSESEPLKTERPLVCIMAILSDKEYCTIQTRPL